MKILIIDDHQLFLEGMEFIFKSRDYDTVCVTSLDAAIEELNSPDDFDLALVDIELAGSSGLTLLQYIKQEKLLIPVVIISADASPSTVSKSIRAGASGYIPKSYSGAHVMEAIMQVLEGVLFLPENLIKSVQIYEQKLENMAQQYGVGQRQLDVLGYIDRGLSNKDIGAAMYISESTVKSHIVALFKAFKARNRVDCIKQAQAQGLLK